MQKWNVEDYVLPTGNKDPNLGRTQSPLGKICDLCRATTEGSAKKTLEILQLYIDTPGNIDTDNLSQQNILINTIKILQTKSTGELVKILTTIDLYPHLMHHKMPYKDFIENHNIESLDTIVAKETSGESVTA